ncbi:MAG TPA: hypothetical protein VF779_16885 [Pyrinomonadaceae bacterium]
MKRVSLLILIGLTLISCKTGGSIGSNSTTLSSNSANSGNVENVSKAESSEAPKKVVEEFVADAAKGDTAAMSKVFSKQFIEKKGQGKVDSLNKGYSDMIRKMAAGQKAEIFGENARVKGDQAWVTFNYGSQTGTSTGCTAFALVKEDASWKINDTPDCADIEP